jgi:hypothetical protein
MPDFTLAFRELNRWLDERQIGKRSLHVILNFSDGAEAAQFVASLQSELAERANWVGSPTTPFPNDVEVAGIKVKIETPFG